MTHTKIHHPASVSRRRAFTLIEILIVIALTTLLFALLLVPLVSAIKYTRQVQSLTAAQDAVRITRERLTRELSSAVFVFDNTSHRFTVPTGAIRTGSDVLYTNFLNLDVPTSAVGGKTVAHAYNAKLDLVLPRVNNTPVTDPTTNEPIAYAPSTSGSAVITSPAQIFPSAAGSSLVRYWVGLKDSSLPYNNNREANANRSGTDNTYILYRAQFPIYNIDPATGKLVKNADGTTINEKLFAPQHDASGVIVNQPELDDPDFFRIVVDTEIDWLDDAHDTYGATTLPMQNSVSHNQRQGNWQTIAKPVIPGPNVDLILLPRNTDNTINYDTGAPGVCSASSCPGTAHSGIVHDPVTDTYTPVVNTSITFRPGTVSGDANPATTTDYTSTGVPLISENGFSFIPTVYTAAAQSWALPYHVTLTPSAYGNSPPDATQAYYDTDIASSVLLDSGGVPLVNVGDVIEYYHANSTGVPDLVYDATNGYPVVASGPVYKIGGTKYIPLTVAPDSGTMNFDTPSLPKGPKDLIDREWTYTPAPGSATIDLRNADDSGNPSDLPGGTPSSTIAPDNAHLVPGSLRVYGPDNAPGPNHGARILYTPINVQAATPADNQYSVDYTTAIITLQSTNPGAVQVVYDYQANMTLSDISKTFAADNPFLPMLVKVDYKTRDLLDISLGVRIYDISTGRAQVIPAEFKVKIGNSNR